MANFTYQDLPRSLMTGEINLVSDTIMVRLCMTNTTADTANTAVFVGDLVTIDVCDGANYADLTLASKAVTTDATNDRGEFDAADGVWSSLGAGTRSNQGMFVYQFVTNDAASRLIGWIDTGGFPFDASGSNVTSQWNVESIMQLLNDAV